MGWYWHCYYWLRWVKPYDSEPMTHSLRVIFWTTRDNLISIVGVGVSDLLKEINGGSSKDLSKVLIGDGMIIFAQIIVAAQMVIEEKFVNGKNIHPLRFIDWLENISKRHQLSGMLYQMGVWNTILRHFWPRYWLFLTPMLTFWTRLWLLSTFSGRKSTQSLSSTKCHPFMLSSQLKNDHF